MIVGGYTMIKQCKAPCRALLLLEVGGHAVRVLLIALAAGQRLPTGSYASPTTFSAQVEHLRRKKTSVVTTRRDTTATVELV